MSKRKVGTFSGPFAPMLDIFVKQKQSIGYDYIGGYSVLRIFDTFSKDYNIENYELSKEIVIDWGKRRLNENEATKSARIRYIQEFATFLINQGYSGYVSPSFRFHFSQHAAYVFTHEEMRRIFEVLDQMPYSPSSPYKHIEFPLLYRMLYGCGFRISELLNLTLNDVDIQDGVVHIHDAKNGNERLVPMSKTLATRCRDYILKYHKGHESQYPFFYKKDGSSYTVSNIDKHFRELLWTSGIPYRGKVLGPRVHDLRHTYICHRLNSWAKDGTDLMTMLPVLAKYVGHVGLSSTQYYLKLTAEAYPDVIEKMEELTGVVFPEVGGIDYEEN